MTITAAHVEQVLRSIRGAYGGNQPTTAELAAGANRALATAPEGLTVKGAAAFLATMSQESGSFRYRRESGSSSYLRGKPYWPYIGRTFEQVTHRSNYALFGAWCKARGLVDDADVFVDDPTELEALRWAWLGGVWFWQANSIWAYGNRGDFLATQQAVNLGTSRIGTRMVPTGFTARRAWYEAWLRIGAELLPAPPTDTTRKVPIMATTDAKSLYRRYRGAQPLTPGKTTEVWIGEQPPAKAGDEPSHDKSLVSGVAAAVDAHATVVIVDAQGRRYSGALAQDPTSTPAGLLRLTGVPLVRFRVVAAKTGATTTVVSERPSSAGDSAYFGGSISKVDKAGFEPRLRLAVELPADAPAGLVIDTVITQGYLLQS